MTNAAGGIDEIDALSAALCGENVEATAGGHWKLSLALRFSAKSTSASREREVSGGANEDV